MNLARKHFNQWLAASLLGAALPARAQVGYPGKPVRLLVGANAGVAPTSSPACWPRSLPRATRT
mgnify:CR=1 FL=1